MSQYAQTTRRDSPIDTHSDEEDEQQQRIDLLLHQREHSELTDTEVEESEETRRPLTPQPAQHHSNQQHQHQHQTSQHPTQTALPSNQSHPPAKPPLHQSRRMQQSTTESGQQESAAQATSHGYQALSDSPDVQTNMLRPRHRESPTPVGGTAKLARLWSRFTALQLNADHTIGEMLANPTFRLTVYSVLLLLSSVGNSLTFKSMISAMQNYSYFLNIFTSAVYVPVFFAFVYYELYWTRSITPVMQQFPKSKFAVMGLFDSLAGVLAMFGAVGVSGSNQALLSNAVIPVTMALSYLLLKQRFRLVQIAGSVVIMGGIVFALMPNLLTSVGVGQITTTPSVNEEVFFAGTHKSSNRSHPHAHHSALQFDARDQVFSLLKLGQPAESTDQPSSFSVSGLHQVHRNLLQRRFRLSLAADAGQSDADEDRHAHRYDQNNEEGESDKQCNSPHCRHSQQSDEQHQHQHSDESSQVTQQTHASQSAPDVPLLDFLFILSAVPSALSSIYKELAFVDSDMSANYLQAWVALWQLLFGFALIPLNALTFLGPQSVPFSKLLSALTDGMQCLLGRNVIVEPQCTRDEFATLSAAMPLCDDCSGAWLQVSLYLFFNLLFNVFTVLCIKFGSATLMFILMALRLPLVQYAFSLPMFQNPPDEFGASAIVGLIVILVGLALYRWPTAEEEDEDEKNASITVDGQTHLPQSVKRYVMPLGPGMNQVFAQEHQKRQERCRKRLLSQSRPTKTAHQLRSQFYTSLGLIDSPSTPLSTRRGGASPLLGGKRSQPGSVHSHSPPTLDGQQALMPSRPIRSYGSLTSAPLVAPSSRSPLLSSTINATPTLGSHQHRPYSHSYSPENRHTAIHLHSNAGRQRGDSIEKTLQQYSNDSLVLPQHASTASAASSGAEAPSASPSPSASRTGGLSAAPPAPALSLSHSAALSRSQSHSGEASQSGSGPATHSSTASGPTSTASPGSGSAFGASVSASVALSPLLPSLASVDENA